MGKHFHYTSTETGGSETNGTGLFSRYQSYGDDDSYSLKGPMSYTNVTHITTDNGNHSHTGNTQITGGGEKVTNTPPYYVLAYIMKL